MLNRFHGSVSNKYRGDKRVQRGYRRQGVCCVIKGKWAACQKTKISEKGGEKESVDIYYKCVRTSLVISARNSSSPNYLVSWVRCEPVEARGDGLRVNVGQGSSEEVVPHSTPLAVCLSFRLSINHTIIQIQAK